MVNPRFTICNTCLFGVFPNEGGLIPSLVRTRARASPLRGAFHNTNVTAGFILSQDKLSVCFNSLGELSTHLLQDTSLIYVGVSEP